MTPSLLCSGRTTMSAQQDRKLLAGQNISMRKRHAGEWG